ncbi:MAG: ShlB/FhaC/HecB family hemolysin secretion/activation protein [Xanthobacteraceae bacterium]|nr:ShlB/FhaC/HecB family hemolysin secretion/activation protein [Xanthobacteraceae bacterium]
MAFKAYRCLLAAALLCIPAAALAQAVPPSAEPGRERDRFTAPPTPQAQPRGPAIVLPSTTAPPQAATVRLRLRNIRIEGSTVYSKEDLKPLYEELLDREVSLQEIYDLAQRITAKYGQDGYALSRAIIPPQQLTQASASVRIQVVEGFIDNVEWPAALSRYRDFFSAYAAKITAERPINVRTIERYLLLASDLPGLKFTSRLKASTRGQVGASTLVVEVVEKKLDFTIGSDNRGTFARGPYQAQTGISFNNLFGDHASLSATYAGTFQAKELQYLSLTYRQVVSSEALSFFATGIYSFGHPGTPALTTLEYHNRSLTFEAGASFPFIRTRERNLTGTVLLFASDSSADILGGLFNEDRLRGARARLNTDWADQFSGVNQINLTFSQGFDSWGSTHNGNPFASRAAGKVDFTKIESIVARTQPVFAGVSLYGSIYGQYAWTPLLAPEECGYGGKLFGRSFDPSQMTGDHCWMATAELRYNLPLQPGVISAMQVYSFIDRGEAYHIEPAIGTGPTVTGTSAGAGIRLDWLEAVNMDFTAAKTLEGPAEGNWRFFFVLSGRR